MYIARCPFCSFRQKTNAKKVVRCFRCNRTYVLFPSRSFSRVVGKVGI